MAITKLNSLAIPDNSIVEADLSYPLTNFSSTGIDDNASSTALTIDSAGRVGIGSSPDTNMMLHVHKIDTNRLYLTSAGNAIQIIGDPAATGMFIDNESDAASNISFRNTSSYSERMRILGTGDIGYSGKLFSSNVLTSAAGLQLYRDHATGSCYLFDTTTAPYNGPLIFGTSNTESMRISTAGHLDFSATSKIHTTAGIHTDSDTEQLLLTNNDNEASSGVSIVQWGRQHASTGFQGDIHYIVDSRGSSGKHRFYEYNGSGWTNLVSIDGAGITFDSGTNYLDDYEEGTWTPAITGTSGIPSITYSHRSAYYIKTGNSIIARWGMRISSISGGSGTTRITGLPYTGKSYGSYQQSACFSNSQGLTTDADGPVLFYVEDGQSTMQGRLMTNSDTVLPLSYFQAGSWCIGTIIYDVT